MQLDFYLYLGVSYLLTTSYLFFKSNQEYQAQKLNTIRFHYKRASSPTLSQPPREPVQPLLIPVPPHRLTRDTSLLLSPAPPGKLTHRQSPPEVPNYLHMEKPPQEAPPLAMAGYLDNSKLGFVYVTMLGLAEQVIPHMGALRPWATAVSYVMRLAPVMYWAFQARPAALHSHPESTSQGHNTVVQLQGRIQQFALPKRSCHYDCQGRQESYTNRDI